MHETQFIPSDLSCCVRPSPHDLQQLRLQMLSADRSFSIFRAAIIPRHGNKITQYRNYRYQNHTLCDKS